MNERKQNALAGLIAYIIIHIREGKKSLNEMQDEIKNYVVALEEND